MGFNLFSRKDADKIAANHSFSPLYPIPDTPEIREVKIILHNGMGLEKSGRYKSAISTYEIAAARLNEYITELKASLNETP